MPDLILAALQNGQLSSKELFSAVGGNRNNFDRALKELKDTNQIIMSGEGTRGSPFTFKLA